MLTHIDRKFFILAVGSDSIGQSTDIDISARCPVCGDSRKKKRSKRLHLYKKNDVVNVNCFNGDCPVKNKTVYSFLRDFYPSVADQYKREQWGTKVQDMAQGKFEPDVLERFKKKPETEKEVLTQDLSGFFQPINEAPAALEYLENRLCPYDESQYGKWYFGIQDLNIGDRYYKLTDNVIVPLWYRGEMYGFYSRNIYQKDFFTYMNEANIGYKIWNWFGVNRNKPVFIFEGIFDAIASGLPNVIASMGAKIPDARLKELKHPIFVLDNDKTGLLNSMKYARQGIRVYIQPNLYKQKDINALKLENPKLNVPELILQNLYTGIIAEVRIKGKL